MTSTEVNKKTTLPVKLAHSSTNYVDVKNINYSNQIIWNVSHFGHHI